VTIGVELAAKPSLLLFLDEPTSGLDSQSAFSIVRFLKKLAKAGQAIICTIHQPSSVLVQQFDMILALNPGGNTFYFGPVGDNGSAVNKYFADRGVQCPPHKNVAEFILETAAKGGKRADGKRLNWNEEWKNSEEAKEVLNEIKRIKGERSKVKPRSASEEHELASPIPLQITELTKRMFLQHWRSPEYLYGKVLGINGDTLVSSLRSVLPTGGLCTSLFTPSGFAVGPLVPVTSLVLLGRGLMLSIVCLKRRRRRRHSKRVDLKAVLCSRDGENGDVELKRSEKGCRKDTDYVLLSDFGRSSVGASRGWYLEVCTFS